ncbi:MAG: natural product biosynthesis luciferase-like monooxygenase protein [Planctomycetota bacterium]|jgi:natural product biosynthesis luciferase-like monooxygenase protein
MSSTSLAAVFFGSDTLLLQCLESWQHNGHRVVAVVTDAEKVRRHCAEKGLPCVDDAAALIEKVAGEEFDVLFAITWLHILPEPLLQLPLRAAINFHDGPLPRYAGLNATCWALHAGERKHAVTWHVIESVADTGAILLQERFDVSVDDTAFTLNARCFEAGRESFETLTGQIAANALSPQPQDLSVRSYFGRNARPDGLAVIDFHRPTADVARLVRAFDHGGYRNPIAVAKCRASKGVFVPGGVEEVAKATAVVPGTVTVVGDDFVQVACTDGEVKLLRPRGLDNRELDASALSSLGVAVGTQLPVADDAVTASWTAVGKAAANSEHDWLEVLAAHVPLPVPGGSPSSRPAVPAEFAVDLGGQVSAGKAAAMVACFLSRNSATATFSLGLRKSPAVSTEAAGRFVADCPPVIFEFAAEVSVTEGCRAAAAAMDEAMARGPLLREVLVRHADRLPTSTVLEPVVQLWLVEAPVVIAPGGLVFAVSDASLTLCYDRNAIAETEVSALARRLQVFARAAAANGEQPLRTVPVLADAELHTLLHEWNETVAVSSPEQCVHRQVEQQAKRTPTRIALRLDSAEVTYLELQQRVVQLAGWLRGVGVDRGDHVGICTSRGIDMVVAVLATMRCGAAYVPLDPSYPNERLRFMADDANLAALVVDETTTAMAPPTACPRIDLDVDRNAIGAADALLADEAEGDDLAYMIYTSGSTGRPKGVMVRHRNAANFFTGMDRVLGMEDAGIGDGEDPGVWLAVTSLSFDISVLELLWTLCRGFTVVMHRGESHAAQASKVAAAAPARSVSFSMFYFASDEGEHAEDKYRLLHEGARFADENGFEAVWTPERHFHAFGGLYPNPAVVSAAIAAVTKNVKIRAGSCVATLHHPIRIAEDWALVDNLSHGRVGVAFAAGWHGRDFVLRPENFADRKVAMVDTMKKVHALWRGESLPFEGPDGKSHDIRTLPRPVQKELPTWVTVAGNPETYRIAGETGSFVLTHLLGQSVEDLKQKLVIYRDAWRAAGHAGEGHVTLMLHTFVGDDEQSVREIVREPMKEYLRSSLDLVKQAAWSFPAFKNKVGNPGELDALLNGGLTPEDFEALLDFSFERYYQSSGLFGTPESCVAIVDRLRAVKIDEIACLVDFGISTDQVMASLPHLLDLKQRCDSQTAAAEVASKAEAKVASIPQLIEANAVTHFQCTPSMAGMLMLDPATAPAFKSLKHMLVGGEALPVSLARQLTALGPNVHDVYGPTETTVWSTTQLVGDDDPVPIGRPLANQRVYVLDANRQPVAVGHPGELWIGGAGVTAGYFRRPELTAECFVPDPFVEGGTMYRTGDLARWQPSGVLEYLGRTDHQVKVRGYRIELGEIEAALSHHVAIRESVVVARVDGGETRLCAYYVAHDGAAGKADTSAEELRSHLRSSLPEFMVPGHFVVLSDLPRTPNLKIDRKALPSPEEAVAVGSKMIVSAQNDAEGTILSIWRESLGTDAIGVEDNFFDSGGHSILAVKVHREICQRLDVELQITDLFRFTTVRALAHHLEVGKSAPSAAQQAAERAKQRRLLRRR